jgi:hypothetical protein
MYPHGSIGSAPVILRAVTTLSSTRTFAFVKPEIAVPRSALNTHELALVVPPFSIIILCDTVCGMALFFYGRLSAFSVSPVGS